MRQIADGVWQIPVLPRQSVNCYLVGDVLVDAGVRWSGPKLLRALKGRTVAAHMLTHAHPDHQGATHAVCTALGLPLWCHALEREAAETGQVTAAYPEPQSRMAKFQQKYLAGPGHPVARTLAEGDDVAGFQVVHVPGHTPGQIALWRESDGTLIAGDAAVGMNLVTTIPGIGLPLAVATVDMNEARRSVKKLADLGPARVAFGHGPLATGEAFRRFAHTV